MTLNGAQIVNKTPDINHADGTVTQGVASNGSITIDTGNLTITTPQNNSKDGNNYSVNALGSLPIASIGFGNGKPPDIPYTQGTLGGGVKDIHNNYQSTEQTMSGIAAGSGGLKVNASGTTTLNGGSITSTADISKNQITTGHLIGNSLNNHSVWSGLNVSGSETVKSQYTVAGTATEAKNNTLLPGNVVNNAKGPQAIGNVVIHNEHTVTDAVIGGNIVVNAGSTTGKISNDAEAANGYIKDRFDANKMQNNFNHQNDIAQNITTILTNIVNAVAPDKGQSQQTPPGQISDHDIGMMVSSGLGSIGGALFGKGDVGATVAAAAGDMANIYLPNIGQTIADQISPNQKNPKDPRNINNNQKTERIFPNNQKAKNEGSNVIKNLTYDTVTDINKIVAGFAHDVIVGGLGALTGIIAGGGNVGLDATAG